MANFRVFEFDLMQNKFVIGFDYKGIGKQYVNGTFCLSPSAPHGILILSLNKGVSDSEPIQLFNLSLYPDETKAIKTNINKHIKRIPDKQVEKDINEFLNSISNESKDN